MANNIKLVTYAGSTVTPQDDALVYETAVGQNGIMSGCAMAIKNNNTLHISAGHGIVCGRKFSVVESDITVLLTTGDTLAGRVYVHLDLSNTTDPIQIMTETGSSLTEPIQQTDVNISNGIYEFNLATFTIDALTIADLVDVKPIVEKITDKLDNAKVDTLTTLEQVEATTDDTIPVGAGAVKQLNESLGGTAGTSATNSDYSTLPLASALASACDNNMSTGVNGISYNGRFKSADGTYSYNAYYCNSSWTGFITSVKVSDNKSYSFYRKAGADAVLKELGSSGGGILYVLTSANPSYETNKDCFITINGVSSSSSSGAQSRATLNASGGTLEKIQENASTSSPFSCMRVYSLKTNNANVTLSLKEPHGATLGVIFT